MPKVCQHEARLEAVRNGVRSLESQLGHCRSDGFCASGTEFKSLLIAGVVYQFRFVLMDCRSMIWWRLSDCFGVTAVSELSLDGLFRLAAKEGLISDLNCWLEYFELLDGNVLRIFERVPVFVEFLRKEKLA